MAQITNLTTLIAEVKLWVRDTNTTDDTVKGWIQLAESSFRRTLATLDNEDTFNSVVPAGGLLALPTGYNGLREIYVVASPNKPLRYISPSQMTQFGNLTGQPTFYTILDGNFKFSPDIEGDTVEAIYFKKLDDLTDAAPTNYLILDYPDVYLAGTLRVAQKFLRDDTDAAQHNAIVTNWIDEMKRQNIRQKYSGQEKRVGVNPVVGNLR